MNAKQYLEPLLAKVKILKEESLVVNEHIKNRTTRDTEQFKVISNLIQSLRLRHRLMIADPLF